jgi:hypothetical protein
MRYTLVLNNDFIPVSIVDSRRAFLNVYKDVVHLISSYDDVKFHSTNAEWDIPSVVRSRRRINLPFQKATLTKENVLKRDGYKCVYCGDTSKRYLTIDHVLPKSRGGRNGWRNVVACCFSCNNLKDDHTPEEMGWEHPDPQHPHYLVLMSNFTKDIPTDWKHYLFM